MRIFNDSTFAIFLLLKLCLGPFPSSQMDSSVTIFQNANNSTLQNLNILLQIPQTTSESVQIRISLVDERNKTLDKTMLQIDDEFTNTVKYTGTYMSIVEWLKTDDGSQIQITGFLQNTANKHFLRIEQVKEDSSTKELLRQRIEFSDKVKLKLYLQSEENEKNMVANGTTATFVCRLQNKNMKIMPKFYRNSQFLHEKLEEDSRKMEVRLSFSARKEDHSKTIVCGAGKVNRSMIILVSYAPTSVRVTPPTSDMLSVGSHLQCSPLDGYPRPVVTWELVSGPPNAEYYYAIKNVSRTFVLKDTAPVGSNWQIRCKSANEIGNFSFYLKFTAEQSRVTLLLKEILRFSENRVTLLLKEILQLMNKSPSAINVPMSSIRYNKLVFADFEASFDKAIMICKDIGLNLIRIDSPATESMINHYTFAHKFNGLFWIDVKCGPRNTNCFHSDGTSVKYKRKISEYRSPNDNYYYRRPYEGCIIKKYPTAEWFKDYCHSTFATICC